MKVAYFRNNGSITDLMKELTNAFDGRSKFYDEENIKTM